MATARGRIRTWGRILLAVVMFLACWLVAAEVGAIGELAPRPKGDQQTEQSVTLHLPPSAMDGEVALADIEDLLAEAIDAAGIGEYEGSESGPNGATLYMYGPDADQLAATVRPVLEKLHLPHGSYLIKRYGDVGARKERINLPR